MSTEGRLRDLMAAYQVAASAAPTRPLHGSGSETEQPEADTQPPGPVADRSRHRRFWSTAAVVATAAALIFVFAVQHHNTSASVKTTPAGPLTEEVSVASYLTAIQTPYQRLYQAGEQWWYTPPQSHCRQAALDWTSVARDRCRADDLAAAGAARRLGDLLSRLQPPTEIQAAHQALITAVKRFGVTIGAQLGDLSRADRQAFLDRARPIGDALGSICQSVDELNHSTTSPLPVDNNWCTG